MKQLFHYSLIVLFIYLNGCCFTPYRFHYVETESPRYMSTVQKEYSKNPGENIIIVSYNIKYSNHIEKAIQLIKDSSSLQKADIICLQEMDIKGVEKIAQLLEYNYVYYPSSHNPRHKKDFGPAILTKFPIKRSSKILLPPFCEKKMHKIQRIAVCAEVLIGGKPLTITSTHLGVFISPQKRTQQIESILDHLKNYSGSFIIAGDFNTFNSRHYNAIAKPLSQSQFSLATGCVHWTYKNWYLLNKKTVYDYIFVKDVLIEDCGSVSDRTVSDHLPIWTTISLP